MPRSIPATASASWPKAALMAATSAVVSGPAGAWVRRTVRVAEARPPERGPPVAPRRSTAICARSTTAPCASGVEALHVELDHGVRLGRDGAGGGEDGTARQALVEVVGEHAGDKLGQRLPPALAGADGQAVIGAVADDLGAVEVPGEADAAHLDEAWAAGHGLPGLGLEGVIQRLG